MHCEQNFNKNMLKIVTNAKDSVKMRWDLQCRAIRPICGSLTTFEEVGRC